MFRHWKGRLWQWGLCMENILYSYVKEDITNVKKHMKDKKMEFNKWISNINYSPKNKFYAVE